MTALGTLDRKPVQSVYAAKGIGIILVVVNHFQPDDSPAIWMQLMVFLSPFLMPLFFMLSGYLYRGVPDGKFRAYIIKKANRLLYPFVSIAVIVFLIKFLPSLYFKLVTPVNMKTLIWVFINPYISFAPFLWFVYTLFIIFAMAPFIQKYLKNDLLILGLTGALSFVDVTDYFCISKLFQHLPFFFFGVFAAKVIDLDVRRTPFVTLPFFGAAVTVTAMMSGVSSSVVFYDRLALFVAAFSGSVMCILLAMILNTHLPDRMFRIIVKIGVYSVSIYLFHTIFESSVRIFLYQILKTGMPFELKAMLAIAAGIIGPVILEKQVINRFYVTRKYLLGTL